MDTNFSKVYEITPGQSRIYMIGTRIITVDCVCAGDGAARFGVNVPGFQTAWFGRAYDAVQYLHALKRGAKGESND